jgi:hypothetical protein
MFSAEPPRTRRAVRLQSTLRGKKTRAGGVEEDEEEKGISKIRQNESGEML